MAESALTRTRGKVALLGDTRVGKTCLTISMAGEPFPEDGPPTTVGGSVWRLTLNCADNRPVYADLWDTAGQEQYKTIVPMYLRNVCLVLLCFSLAESASLAHIAEWKEMAAQVAGTTAAVALVGCKCDEDRAVSVEEMQDVGEAIGARFVMETSALTGEGIKALRTQIAETIAACERLCERLPAPTPTPASRRGGCC